MEAKGVPLAQNPDYRPLNSRHSTLDPRPINLSTFNHLPSTLQPPPPIGGYEGQARPSTLDTRLINLSTFNHQPSTLQPPPPIDEEYCKNPRPYHPGRARHGRYAN
jgi:hypothetical protein